MEEHAGRRGRGGKQRLAGGGGGEGMEMEMEIEMEEEEEVRSAEMFGKMVLQ